MARALYSEDEIACLLEKAKALGYDIKAGCELEKWTIFELDQAVNGWQC